MRLGILGSVSASECLGDHRRNSRQDQGHGLYRSRHRLSASTSRSSLRPLRAPGSRPSSPRAASNQPMMWAPFKNLIQDDREAMERDFALYEQAIRLAVDVGCSNVALWPAAMASATPTWPTPGTSPRNPSIGRLAAFAALPPLARRCWDLTQHRAGHRHGRLQPEANSGDPRYCRLASAQGESRRGSTGSRSGVL